MSACSSLQPKINMSKKRRADKATSVINSPKSKDKGSDLSPKVPQRDKIDYPLNIRERNDLTEKQKQLIDLILDKNTKLIFLDGPAGTSKTFSAILAGLMLLNKHAVSDILYIRSIAESASKSLGSLPGTTEEKIMPFLMPLVEKLDELLPRPDVARLLKEERVSGMPINYLRGASFNARFILADESQNLNKKELTTLITRLGMFSKMVVAGDKDQSDINGMSGFSYFFDLFNDEESRQNGIHCFAFTKEDIVRSGILKYIIGRLEERGKASVRSEPMFPPRS